MTTPYAELHATSNFSFLRGASHAFELMATAEVLGITALGVCDHNTLAGVVRPWTARKDNALKVRPLTGCRLNFTDRTPSLLVYPKDRAAYGRLTRLLTIGQLREKKGDCHLTWADFLDHAEGQFCLVVPPDQLDAMFEAELARIAGELSDNAWLSASRGYRARDVQRLHRLSDLAKSSGAPMVAVGDVLYHAADRRPLQDVLTAIRENTTVQAAGFLLEANAERRLKSPNEMARLFRPWPDAIERTTEIVERIEFDLGQLSYEYPDEPVPPGKTANQHLRDLTEAGIKWRYPAGEPAKVRKLIEDELALIAELGYPNYFLTVHDIVRWARDQGILCQGRGSAANSAVCYCLGVTSADPFKHNLLFARFLSKERSEPPDIDVDFEHERREEVMQYVYRRYGREKAAICATVIHYRPRMAIRQVGKALGLTDDVTALMANTVWGSWGSGMPDEHIRQTGLDVDNPQIRQAVTLATELIGFPRHLSQHVGGYVLTKQRLDETVPIGNAAMPDRTFIEWDKDDIDSLGLMKVDILALGMLTAIQRGLVMLEHDHGEVIGDIAEILQVRHQGLYDMLSEGDSVGVFQVESRAQMSMLPRLRPQQFYDLVIEVAIVRPGPIQGDMVHPYLRRREGKDKVEFPSPSPEHGPANELEAVLEKTLGIPLFQEQAMKMAIEAAKFTPDEANGLRRAMATFRNHGTVGNYREKFIGGMVVRGYQQDFAERCFKQIEGFGSYGFPESHAISFALLVYVSAWMKWKWPDVFCAALLNSQPMGFYQPSQLVRDAKEHGVEVRPPDILASDWDSTLEPAADSGRLKAVRLGLRQITGFREAEAEALMAARHTLLPSRREGSVAPQRAGGGLTVVQNAMDLPAPAMGPSCNHRNPSPSARSARGFPSPPGGGKEGEGLLAALARRAGLSRAALEKLAEADALRSLGMDRRQGLWAVKGLGAETTAAPTPLYRNLDLFEEEAVLPQMPLPLHVAEDFRTTSLSLKAHPVSFYRPMLDKMGCTPASALKTARDGKRVSVAGLVLIRQRPGSAKGVMFMTLEDETGVANSVVWPDIFEKNRRLCMSTAFVVVHGKVQSQSGVIHLVADRFTDLSDRLSAMRREDLPPPRLRQEVKGRLMRSRDFH